MKYFASVFLFLLFSTATSTSALAVPLNPGFSAPNSTPYSTHSAPTNSTHVSALSFEFGDDYQGIVGLSNCSGSLIRFVNSDENDKAIVLSNGHCLESGFPKAGEVIVDKVVSRSIRLLDPATGRTKGSVTGEKVLYATMTKTDISLYLLNKTYREIQDEFGVKPLTLSQRSGQPGDSIKIVSGYWRRIFPCSIEAIVPVLKEHEWTMNDSLRYSRPGCEVIPGTSGSPIISEKDGVSVLGINNTINEDGEKCTMNNPCEVREGGAVFYQKGYAYGQQTALIYTCLDKDRKIDLNRAGCELPKPQPVAP